MNGMCLADYVENGQYKCGLVLPWWCVFLFICAVAVVLFWKATK